MAMAIQKLHYLLSAFARGRHFIELQCWVAGAHQFRVDPGLDYNRETPEGNQLDEDPPQPRSLLLDFRLLRTVRRTLRRPRWILPRQLPSQVLNSKPL